MNFLPAKVQGGQTVLDDGTVLCPAPAGVAEGQRFTAGVRPEHLSAASTGAAGQVTLVEPTGAEIQFTIDLAGTPVLITTRDRLALRPGETLHLAVEPGQLHAFDADSGLRLE